VATRPSRIQAPALRANMLAALPIRLWESPLSCIYLPTTWLCMLSAPMHALRTQLVVERGGEVQRADLVPLAALVMQKQADGDSRSVDGLRPGDFIVSINGRPAKSVDVFKTVFAQAAVGNIDLLVEQKTSPHEDKGMMPAVLAF
jgi:hypothetical protein